MRELRMLEAYAWARISPPGPLRDRGRAESVLAELVDGDLEISRRPRSTRVWSLGMLTPTR